MYGIVSYQNVAQQMAIRAQVSAGNGNSINQLSYQNTLNNSMWSVETLIIRACSY